MTKKRYLSTDMMDEIHWVVEETRAVCGQYVGRPEFTVATALTSLAHLLRDTDKGCTKCADIALDQARPRKKAQA